MDDFDRFLAKTYELQGSRMTIRCQQAVGLTREQVERMITYLRTAADQMPTLGQRLRSHLPVNPEA